MRSQVLAARRIDLLGRRAPQGSRCVMIARQFLTKHFAARAHVGLFLPADRRLQQSNDTPT
jgi:hypothetical protein